MFEPAPHAQTNESEEQMALDSCVLTDQSQLSLLVSGQKAQTSHKPGGFLRRKACRVY